MIELQRLMLQYLESLDDTDEVETTGTCKDIAETELSMFNDWLEEQTKGIGAIH